MSDGWLGYEFEVEKARRKAQIKKGEQRRLARLALEASERPRRRPLHFRLLAWAGRQLMALGWRLQGVRGGVAPARLTAQAGRRAIHHGR